MHRLEADPIFHLQWESLAAAKRIIRYLIQAKDNGIRYTFNENSQHELIGYSDSDYANDLDTRRSTTGYIFTLNGSPVTWSSQRQQTVALSTTEAEYMAACEATKEAIWLRQLMKDIQEPFEQPKLLVDNQSAIRLGKNPEFHKRTKHIEVKYHFIREKVRSGEIVIEYVNTEDQMADILTKPLPKQRFNKLKDNLLTKE